MSDIKEKLVKQASKLVCTIADNLSSGEGYTEEGLEERINEYVNDAIDTQDIDNKVEEALAEADLSDKMEDALENADLSDKVQDVLDNHDSIVDEDKATELANDAIGEIDWYHVISENDLATEDWVDKRIREEMDAKLFSFLQGVAMKCFEHDHQAWIDAIRQQGVNKYKMELEAKKEESTETETKEECES